MNYGNEFFFIIIEFEEPFLCFSSRAGVPEKYCADIERKISAETNLNKETTANTSAVH